MNNQNNLNKESDSSSLSSYNLDNKENDLYNEKDLNDVINQLYKHESFLKDKIDDILSFKNNNCNPELLNDIKFKAFELDKEISLYTLDLIVQLNALSNNASKYKQNLQHKLKSVNASNFKNKSEDKPKEQEILMHLEIFEKVSLMNEDNQFKIYWLAKEVIADENSEYNIINQYMSKINYLEECIKEIV